MKKETLVLGGVAAVCVSLLAAALIVRSGGRADGSSQAGVAPPTEEGAAPTEGGTVPAAATGEPAGESAPAATESATPPAQPEETAEPSFTSEQNRREVTLFFQEATNDYLGPEKRKIFLTSSVADQAKQIVVELITGPLEKQLLPTFPPQTKLRGLYLDRSGTAFVDLSSELADLHPGGTSEELATIFSLVDSLSYNLPEIKRVHILVNGEERDTLKSHLDLRRDYSKDMSIVDMDRKGAQ
ncbi:MAG TPA: GerMN domain-containing protein [Candidatus Polarisedimenticolia bacterium]|nr:GerMN domain-containing protein [Candidatus Polarisedimenticolia bacterium]